VKNKRTAWTKRLGGQPLIFRAMEITALAMLFGGKSKPTKRAIELRDAFDSAMRKRKHKED
jgi:hypothetical protein